jgi:hypothetical protein
MWRVKTSRTQARQIHFSDRVMDSGGKAERSKGLFALVGILDAPWRPRLGLGTSRVIFAVRFLAAGRFFAGGAERFWGAGLERLAIRILGTILWGS